MAALGQKSPFNTLSLELLLSANSRLFRRKRNPARGGRLRVRPVVRFEHEDIAVRKARRLGAVHVEVGERCAAGNQHQYRDVYALRIGQRTDGDEPGAPRWADLGTAAVPPAVGSDSQA